MEIDENLARAEPAQEAGHLQRRKVVWAEINGLETGQILASLGGRGNKQFAAETAAVTGDSKTDINRTIRRARDLGPDITRIVGTSLDKGVEVDALMKLPALERGALIDRAVAGEKFSAWSALRK